MFDDRFAGLPARHIARREVPVALTLCARTLGLALLDRPRVGAALLIPRCRSVHTFGMRFALDLLWLDERGRVIRVDRAVAPRRLRRCHNASAVLELAAVTIAPCSTTSDSR